MNRSVSCREEVSLDISHTTTCKITLILCPPVKVHDIFRFDFFRVPQANWLEELIYMKCYNQGVGASSTIISVFLTLTAETLNSGILASGSKASELVRIFAGFSPK